MPIYRLPVLALLINASSSVTSLLRIEIGPLDVRQMVAIAQWVQPMVRNQM